MTKHIRSIVVVLLIFTVVIVVVEKLVYQQSPAQKLTYSNFYAQVEQGNVSKVTIAGLDVAGDFRNPP